MVEAVLVHPHVRGDNRSGQDGSKITYKFGWNIH